MRLIDADALPYEILLRVEADLDENCNLIDKSWPTLVVTPESIDKAPTIDAVPVVRCKECENRNTAKCPIFPQEYEDDYCSYGERVSDKDTVHCKDCKYIMFSDCYGECGIAVKGIVNPDDSCSYGERRTDD